MPVYVINTLGILYIESITNTDVVSGYYNVSCVDDTWSSYHERQASVVLSGISSKNDQYLSAYKIHSFNISTLREKMGGHIMCKVGICKSKKIQPRKIWPSVLLTRPFGNSCY